MKIVGAADDFDDAMRSRLEHSLLDARETSRSKRG